MRAEAKEDAPAETTVCLAFAQMFAGREAHTKPSPRDMSSNGSDRPSLAMMTFPLLRLTTRKACRRAGHLGPPNNAGLTCWVHEALLLLNAGRK